MTPEQIQGRFRAIEVIISQLVMVHIMNRPDKDNIIALLKDGVLGTIGDLKGDAKDSFFQCSEQIFEKAYKTALRLEAELRDKK